MRGLAIGIDLGTAFCRAAAFQNGILQIIEDGFGNRWCPTAVMASQNGDCLFGNEHLGLQHIRSPNLLARLYRYLRTVTMPESCSKQRSTRELSQVTHALEALLGQIRQRAESQLQQVVQIAVVAVPAGLTYPERWLLRRVCGAAGLKRVRFISSSVAAGLDSSPTGHKYSAVVVSIGAGTTDIAVLTRDGGVLLVDSKFSDPWLGGVDFDDVIVDLCMKELEAEGHADAWRDPLRETYLARAAEQAKIELSTANTTEIELRFLAAKAGEEQTLRVSLTRDKLRYRTQHLTDAVTRTLHEALSAARGRRINDLVLCGGGGRLPFVVESVRNEVRSLSANYPWDARLRVSDDEAAVRGAAKYASGLVGEAEAIVILDCLSNSIGIESAGGNVSPIIVRSTCVPCEHRIELRTPTKRNAGIAIRLVETASSDQHDCVFLGQLLVSPERESGIEGKIHIGLEVNQEDRLTVRAGGCPSNWQASQTLDSDTVGAYGYPPVAPASAEDYGIPVDSALLENERERVRQEEQETLRHCFVRDVRTDARGIQWEAPRPPEDGDIAIPVAIGLVLLAISMVIAATYGSGGALILAAIFALIGVGNLCAALVNHARCRRYEETIESYRLRRDRIREQYRNPAVNPDSLTESRHQSPDRNHKEETGRPLPIVVCPDCKTRVVIKEDGTCPACGRQM